MRGGRTEGSKDVREGSMRMRVHARACVSPRGARVFSRVRVPAPTLRYIPDSPLSPLTRARTLVPSISLHARVRLSASHQPTAAPIPSHDHVSAAASRLAATAVTTPGRDRRRSNKQNELTDLTTHKQPNEQN